MKNKTYKFNFIKLFICLYILLIHRKVFYNQYRQNYKITLKDRPILIWYTLIFKIYPDFRAYLNLWKPLLIHAYNQKKATIKQQLAFWHIKHINTERYSAYI